MASRCHHALKKPVFDTLHTVHIHDIHTRARVCIIFCYASLRLCDSIFVMCSRNADFPSLSLSFSLCSSSHLVIVTHAVNISFSSFLVFLPFYPSICFSLLLYNSLTNSVSRWTERANMIDERKFEKETFKETFFSCSTSKIIYVGL